MVGRLPYAVDLDEVEPRREEEVWAGEGCRIEAFPTRHSVASVGYAVREEERPGAFDVPAARALGVPEGPAWGRLQRGEQVQAAGGRTVSPDQVLGAPRPGRLIVVSGDTRRPTPCSPRPMGLGARARGHLPRRGPRPGARDAAQHGARGRRCWPARPTSRCSVLTHLSSRCSPRDIRHEAEREFPRVLVPRDFDQIEMPFPERGAPEIHALRGGVRPGSR